MYEVLYYLTNGNYEYYEAITFKTRKQALAFYEEHKNDEDKHSWWVTRRNKDWEVVEDIIA